MCLSAIRKKYPLMRANVCAEDSSLCVILTTRNDWACLHLGFPLFLRVLFVSELERITIDSPNALNSTMILPPSRLPAATLLYLSNYKPQPILTYKQGLFSQQYLGWQFRFRSNRTGLKRPLWTMKCLNNWKLLGTCMHFCCLKQSTIKSGLWEVGSVQMSFSS